MFCVEKYGIVVRATCNVNRCDIYHRIINLIYNNESQPRKFRSREQKNSWFYWITTEKESRDLSRIVMPSLLFH